VRHTVATIVRDRLSLDAAAALLGHADTRTTARYAKPTIAAAAAAVAALPGMEASR
jgi:integrase